jgi:Tol biopolymer transport system component
MNMRSFVESATASRRRPAAGTVPADAPARSRRLAGDAHPASVSRIGGRLLPVPAAGLVLALVAGLLGPATPAAAAFPGLNGKIAFMSDRDGVCGISTCDFNIYVMHADGAGQTRLTDHPAADRDPAWSPDGARIAFWSLRDGNAEIYVMNADGSGQTRLTNNPATDVEPAWSPDGTKLAFRTDRDGNAEVYAMGADGSGQQALSRNPAFDGYPAWSPGGDDIAFYSTRDGNPEVYLMTADGSAQRRLTNNPATDALTTWSPDGSRLAFVSDRDGNREIYAMNADGSAQSRLTNHSAEDNVPAWSPDGARIIFESRRSGTAEVWVMTADGSNATKLTAAAGGLGNNAVPDWQPLLPPDSTPPVITKTITGTAGANGWYTSEVTVSWNVTDPDSPITILSGCGADGFSTDTTGSTSSCVASSAGGSATDSVTVKLDRTPPTDISITGGPEAGASHHFGGVPAAPTGCTADGAISGLASCLVTGYETEVGAHTLTAAATDQAGNAATTTRSYTVLAWRLSGFYQPVDMPGASAIVFNTVKNGSTVPLRFNVFAANELTATAAVKSLTHGTMTCDGSAPTDEIETVASGGTSLRYDPTAGQFIYNWKTPAKPGCFKVTMTTQDGSSLGAYFKLR